MQIETALAWFFESLWVFDKWNQRVMFFYYTKQEYFLYKDIIKGKLHIVFLLEIYKSKLV